MAQEQIPLTAVIVDDGGYGMLRYDQEQAGARPTASTCTRPDFAALAAAFGIHAETVDGLDDDVRRGARPPRRRPGAVACSSPARRSRSSRRPTPRRTGTGGLGRQRERVADGRAERAHRVRVELRAGAAAQLRERRLAGIARAVGTRRSSSRQRRRRRAMIARAERDLASPARPSG